VTIYGPSGVLQTRMVAHRGSVGAERKP
jgi:hypothetical protein